MQVKLKVIGGKNDGREIKIAVPEFVIGRGDDAHLRPSSDLISRRHCSLKIDNGKVTIADLGSRNGTFVNGEKIAGPYSAKVGDRLRVGRLQFELLIDHVKPSNKRPKVNGVAEAAARTAHNANGAIDEESITDWLTQEADDDSSKTLQETQQFNLEETPTRMFVRSDEIPEHDAPPSVQTLEESDTAKRKKKQYKKLPPKKMEKSESSKSAADDVLRKFFNRR